MQIRVSVVIAAYNAELYIRQCLDSVISQSMREIEIICVNDGSTDQTLQILQEYAEREPRLIVISQQNKGAGNARNQGLSWAKGTYVSFLDADDFFEFDMLEQSYRRCMEDDADICVFEADLYDQDTNIRHYCDWSFRRTFIPNHIPFSPKETETAKNIFRMFTGWAWDKLFKREFLLKNKIVFQELRTTNDMRFVYMALALAEKITICEKILAHQRIRQSNSLSNTREKSWDCFFYALTSLRDLLISHHAYEQYRQAYVNWALNLALWHRNTISEEYAVKISEMLKIHGFKDMDVLDYEKEYYYDEWDYEQLIEIMTGTSETFLLRRIHEIKNSLEQDRINCDRRIREQDELIQSLEMDKRRLEDQINQIYNSTTYRCGNAILFLPKRIKDKVTKGEK